MGVKIQGSSGLPGGQTSQSVTTLSTNLEKVDHPRHYNMGRFEVIDVIEDWKLGFNLGNAVKYISRAEHKGSEIEDLEKAAWYLRREIELKKKERANACPNLHSRP